MHRATEILQEEHQVIERGLALLERVTRKLAQAESLEPERIAQLLQFFGEFADRCHHGKEEGILFPELERRGIPVEGGPIGVMLMEHEMGRGFIRQMRQCAADLSKEEARRSFREAAYSYISLLRAHIEKEDTVLFPMADGVLDTEGHKKLVERFDQHEKEEIGEGAHLRLLGLLSELEKTLAGKGGEDGEPF